jgi:hypothetical protein
VNYNLVLIAGVAGCYCFGVAMEYLALYDSSKWASETRQRVTERLAKYDGWLRFLDFAGMALIAVGVLRHFRMLTFIPLTSSRILVAAIGVLCIERVIRGWMTWHAVRQSDETAARTRALIAALAGTILQVALAVWVGWWVITHVLVTKKGNAGTGATTVQTTPGSAGTESSEIEESAPPSSCEPKWMTEAEALQYCGKDKAYLELLVAYAHGMFSAPLRSKVDGREMYRRDYMEQIKLGGWPSLEELRNAQPQEDAPTPKPPQPLTERNVLNE